MPNQHTPLSVRMDMNTIPEPMSGCHLWIGAQTKDGYGRINFNGKTARAHRLAFMLAKGPIETWGMVLHSCDNRLCVNPVHLRVGNDADNARDMVVRKRLPRARQTECVHGHPFDEANTYRWHGRRDCRACNRITAARRKKTRPAMMSVAPVVTTPPEPRP